jgi:hypothetical protein
MIGMMIKMKNNIIDAVDANPVCPLIHLQFTRYVYRGLNITTVTKAIAMTLRKGLITYNVAIASNAKMT